ncbi:hypothetical protein SAMN05660443_2557 [Marinospirillum celere]|uniref:Uncharacterized protein n=1 Tax=Marinospirillum celere TaxID=1122252 RepID=A0A1I1IX91_9GAMM|nr:hypothetical protein [Marinospirillum celere]SFC40866.1 hypothetical protein SAMN05660443_2557 [Marinospirillum celere]
MHSKNLRSSCVSSLTWQAGKIEKNLHSLFNKPKQTRSDVEATLLQATLNKVKRTAQQAGHEDLIEAACRFQKQLDHKLDSQFDDSEPLHQAHKQLQELIRRHSRIS